MTEVWVVCLNCNFRRHGSNSEMLKGLHEEKYKDHKCEIRYQKSDTEHVPFSCKDCGVYHTDYELQLSYKTKERGSKESLSDEYETPKKLFVDLCYEYNIFPHLDVCATRNNKRCFWFIPKECDALKGEWDIKDYPNEKIESVWCNPPHSQNEEFVRKAYEQWKKHNINIMMILPSNTMSSKYWHECIEGFAEYHPIKGRIRFLIDGKLSKFPSRNAYVVIIWRKIDG